MLAILLLFAGLVQSCRLDQPEPRGEVRVGMEAEPDQLNLLLARTSYAAQVGDHLFMSLLAFDATSLNLQPALAQSLPDRKIKKGKMELTFDIRPEAVWDDGNPVLANDVLFTIKAILHPSIPIPFYRSYLSGLESISTYVGHPKRLTFHFNAPYILGAAAVGTLPIYSEAHYDPQLSLASVRVEDLLNPVLADSLVNDNPMLQQFAEHFMQPGLSRDSGLVQGAGPYYLEKWKSGEYLKLHKKTNWWGTPFSDEASFFQAQPAQIHFQFLADDATSTSLLQSEVIDVLGGIEPSIFEQLRNDEQLKKRYQLYDPLFLSYYYIGMNTNNPKLADKRTRRALAHLINIERYIKNYMYGLATRTNGPIHPSKPYYHPDLQLINYNPDHAKYLFKEVGWVDSDADGVLDKTVNGTSIALRLTYKMPRSNEIARNIGILLQQAAKPMGIAIQLEVMDFKNLIQDYKKRDYELVFLRLGKLPTLDDLRPSWHTASNTPNGGNRVGFGDAVSDAVIDSIAVCFDEQKRQELYYRIQEMIYEAQPCIFLFCPRERIAIHRRFEAEPSILRPGYFPATFDLKNN